ncbi:hypothetical protein [Mycolicibacterium celeriflavum]|uniref:hypothetical protein n=1 Tax=Mycolicibacterium celeriflavum TaxID=1249101 RepID=UPI003CF3428F
MSANLIDDNEGNFYVAVNEEGHRSMTMWFADTLRSWLGSDRVWMAPRVRAAHRVATSIGP